MLGWLEIQCAVSDGEKGQLEHELAKASAQIVHLEEKCAGLQVEKDDVETRMCAELEEQLVGLWAAEEAADMGTEELVKTKRDTSSGTLVSKPSSPTDLFGI